MPITIQYQPAAQALAQVAFQGGQGQFEQRQDQFGLDVARFGEQQRQFDVGTRLNIEELNRRDRLARFQAAAGFEEQRRAQIGRERSQLFDFLARQQLGQQQAIAEQQQLQQIQAQKAQQQQFDRLREIADQQRDMEFRNFMAKQERVEKAMADGTLRTPQEIQQVQAQLTAEAQRLGLPAPGAEQFGRPRPDPMEAAQEQVAQINEQVYGGQQVAFLQPDGKIDFMPYQNTPAGIAQEHAAKMEIEQLKQQQEQQKLQMQQQQEMQVKQQEAQAKETQTKRANIEKEIGRIEEKRRTEVMKATGGAAGTEGAGQQAGERFDQLYGPELDRLHSQLNALTTTPQKQATTSMGGAPGEGAIPNLPAIMPPGEETFQAVMQAQQLDPRFASIRDETERQLKIIQGQNALYKWLVQDKLPFVNSPEAFWQLRPGTWAVGPDYVPIQAPHRNEQGLIAPRGSVDEAALQLQLHMQGLRSAAMGMYDPNSPTMRHLQFNTRNLPQP